MKMITNIFSIFDPSSSYYRINWFIIIIPMLIILKNKNKISNKKNKLISNLIVFIYREVKQLIKEKNKKSSANLMLILFIVIITINTTAIMPYVFANTAHLSISLTVSLTIWISTIIYGWKNSFKIIIAHITPIGTPINLINFIVIIEIISNIIRPITLSVRLSANILAGHLLLLLLSNFSIIRFTFTRLSALFIFILALLEIIVAFVQAYVLITLISLYHNERT